MSMYNFLQQAAITAKEAGVPKIEAGDIISQGLATVYWIAGVTAVITLIFGGMLYMLSNGDASKITRGKDAILYSIIGLVLVILAFIITNFIVGWF